MTTVQPLQIGVRVGPSSLEIDVDVTSVWDEPVYLMTWLYDWYGILGDPNRDPPTKELAFVFWRGQHDVLFVNGESAPPDPGIMLFAPRRPLGVRLGPGARFRNKLHMKLPLLEWHAYEPPSESNTHPTEIQWLTYRLQVIRSSEARYQQEHPSFPGVWKVGGLGFDLEAATAIMPPITLLRRLEPSFERLR